MPFVPSNSSPSPLPGSDLSEAGLGSTSGGGGLSREPREPKPLWAYGVLPLLVIVVGVTAVVLLADPELVPGLTLMVAGAGALLSLPMLMAVMGLRNDGLRERLATAATVTGTVVGIQVRPGAGNASARTYPQLRFTAAGGQEIEASTATPDPTVRKGDTVTVRYDPSDPQWAVIGDGGLERTERAMRVVQLAMIPGDLAIIAVGAFMAFA